MKVFQLLKLSSTHEKTETLNAAIELFLYLILGKILAVWQEESSPDKVKNVFLGAR